MKSVPARGTRGGALGRAATGLVLGVQQQGQLFTKPDIGDKRCHAEELQGGDGVEVAGEGLLARLLPEHRPASIGTQRSAEESELQKRSFRNPPSPLLGPRLVDPEGDKGEGVHRDDGGCDIGGGEQRLGRGDGVRVDEMCERLHGAKLAREGLPKG